MPVLETVRRVKFPAAAIWAVLSDAAAGADILPWVSGCEVLSGRGAGMRRRCFGTGGSSWQETCTRWEDGRLYTMRLEAGEYPFPHRRNELTLGMEDAADGVQVSVEVRYTPRHGLVGQVFDALVGGRRRLTRACDELLDNLVRRIRDRVWANAVTVRTIIERKGREVVTVAPDTSVAATARLLAERRIGAVLVIEPRERIAGVVSERDVVRALAGQGAAALERPVSEYMTREVVVCGLDDDMARVMACMTERRVRHLPVMDGDVLLGIISIGDVVKERMAGLEAESEGLREYIAGREWRQLYVKGAVAGANPFGPEPR